MPHVTIEFLDDTSIYSAQFRAEKNAFRVKSQLSNFRGLKSNYIISK